MGSGFTVNSGPLNDLVVPPSVRTVIDAFIFLLIKLAGATTENLPPPFGVVFTPGTESETRSCG